MASGRPYLNHPPVEGDVIGVEIDQGMMSILINSVSQGVAFEHPDLFVPNAYVYIKTYHKGDEVGVLQGSTS